MPWLDFYILVYSYSYIQDISAARLDLASPPSDMLPTSRKKKIDEDSGQLHKVTNSRALDNGVALGCSSSTQNFQATADSYQRMPL